MQKKLTMITAYDYPTAKIVDEVGFDYILVGDSLGMTVMGDKDTKSVTMQDILHHLKAVVNGAKNTKIIADLPVNSYNNSADALTNGRLLIQAGAYGVKIEGYKPEIIEVLVKNNIKVMGHLGLLPQTAEKYKVQGRESSEAKAILDDAQRIDKLGLIGLVLECIPAPLAKEITDSITTPTIGIGAGIDCSGQVLVVNDILGLSDFQAKFTKKYADVAEVIRNAIKAYHDDVVNEKFPAKENSFS